jgi:hypothetical protein
MEKLTIEELETLESTAPPCILCNYQCVLLC